jgi:hypothetical protein
MLPPSIERSPVRYSERKVVKTDCTFVEPIGGRVRVGYQANGEKARVVQAPCPEARPFVGSNRFEAHDLFPPPGAALPVSDRQVDVPEAVDRREVHGDILPRQERLELVRPEAAYRVATPTDLAI